MSFISSNWVYSLVILVQVLSALTVIALVLLQNGKGADMGSAFRGGGGGSASLFGAAGAANFLSRSTKWAAVLFFVSTAALAYLGGGGHKGSNQPSAGVLDNMTVVPSGPAVSPEPAPVPEGPASSTESSSVVPPATGGAQ